MFKTINSEINYQNDIFKVKMVTTDKKNPDTIYAEIGTYVTPTIEAPSYKDKIESIKKSLEGFLNGMLKKSTLCSSDHILILDIAYDRIKMDKQSFTNIQIYFRPTFETIQANDSNFKNLSNVLYEKYVAVILPFVQKYFEREGFVCNKKRK